MSWDGVYIAKTHHVTIIDGRRVATCNRKFVRNKTTDPKKATCFACMKKLGIIK